MGLVNLTTNLKSLRYGKDRVGGGSSNQPYITKDLPKKLSDVGRTGGPDVLLRGGTLTPGRILKDVSRLAQMFFDFKSIGGPLFIAKENLLSRTSVATDGQGKALNNGVYLPTSTLLQSAGNSLGLHLNKQGIDPFKGIGKNGGGIFELFGGSDPLGQPSYIEITTNPAYESKLKDFTEKKIDQKTDSTELLNYQGGPGSILGIGKTRIPLSKQRTGLNNPNLNYTKGSVTWAGGIDPKPVDTYFPSSFDLGPPSPPPFSGNNFTNQLNIDTINSGHYNTKYIPSKYTGRNLFTNDTQYVNLTTNDQFKRVGASSKFLEFYGKKSTSSPKPDRFSKFLNKSLGSNTRAFQNSLDLQKFNNNPVTKVTDTIKDAFLGNGKLKDPDSYNTSEEILNRESSKDNPVIGEKFNSQNFSLNYKKNNIENRVGLGNPGKRGIVTNYQIGKTDLNGDVLGPLDLITSMPLYKSKKVTTSGAKNDLVKFRIGIIDNSDPSLKTYVHFRAFLDEMSDNYSADWSGEKLMGRGENFYRYNGFNREISLGWTVMAQSKQELMPMYRKLNYLASSLAPDYSKSIGYMRGNLATLTVGGYLYEQPGIITSLNYSIPQESPWEIAIPANEDSRDKDNPIISDKSVKEMPHMIKVTGFNFIPIHEFTPKIQQNTYSPSGELLSYSDERYIALKNGENDNYNNS
tara:strand:- start:761 stop:2824 length:2064 start_codon:yes stop_codon:yes gene_type:complete